MTKREDYRTIALTEPFDHGEIQKLSVFRSRFKELWANFDDLKRSGLNLNGGFRLERHGGVSSDIILGVSRFRIKGFLVDYRHFHGQEEPAHFLSVSKLVNRRCRDKDVADLIKKNRDDWLSAGLLSGWHNDFNLDEIVDAVFKESVFHTIPSGKKIRVRLEDVETKLTSSAMWFEVTYMAYSRMLIIRNLNWILDQIFHGREELRVPRRNSQ